MLEDTRKRFLEERWEQRKQKQRRVLKALGAVVAVGIGIIGYLNSGPYKSDQSGNYFVEETPSYQGKKVEMTSIEATQADGKVKVNLTDVLEKSIIKFQYDSGDANHEFYGNVKGKMPLMAYLSTAGRVIVASSICEPCYGTEFYLQDQHLVCVACGTRWRNTDLFGEMGGCVKYPPEELKYTIEDDSLVLPQELLINWKPRFFASNVMS